MKPPLEVDPGSTTQTHGIYFSGRNDGIFIDSAEVYGKVIIDENDDDDAFTRNFHMTAKINTSFECYDDDVEGTVRLSGLGTTGTELINHSPRLKIMSYSVPRVLVTKESSQSSITGDGTTANVVFDTATTNNFGNYATTGANAGRFSCTVAGLYRISYTYLLKNIDTGHTRLDSAIRHSDSLTTPVFLRRYTKTLNPANMAVPPSTNGFVAVTDSVTVEMKYDDVMYIETKVSNSTKTVGVYGGSGTVYSWMTVDYVS